MPNMIRIASLSAALVMLSGTGPASAAALGAKGQGWTGGAVQAAQPAPAPAPQAEGPAPTDIALLAAGVVALVIGRRRSRVQQAV